MADEQLTDKIEAWLLGKLPPAEAAAFQAEVAADPELAEEVTLHRLTLRAGRHLSEQHLQQQVLDWMKDVEIPDMEEEIEQVPPPPPLLPPPYRTWLLILAALLLLTGALTVYQMRQRQVLDAWIASLTTQIEANEARLKEVKQSPVIDAAEIERLSIENAQLRQQLLEVTGQPPVPLPSSPIAGYYVKPKLGGATRMGDQTPVEELVKEGERFFDQSNLKQAESKAREVLRRDTSNRDAQRLLAYTLFEQQHFLEAEPFFLTLKNAYSPAYDQHQEAQWHLLLCYRALSADAGKRASYEEELRQVLKNTKHLYRAQALRMKAGMGK